MKGIVKCAVFILVIVAVVSEPCPPVEEGQDFKLTFKRDVDVSMRDIVWSVTYANGSHQEVSHCYHHVEVCYDFTKHITPTKRQENGMYVHELEIAQVGPQHRGMTIHLHHKNRSTSAMETVFFCTMNVYFLPKNPTCSIQVDEDNTNATKITCDADKSFPVVSCEIYQVDLKTQDIQILVGNSDIVCDNVTFNNDKGFEYQKTLCSAIVPLENVQKYGVYGKMSISPPIIVDDAVVYKDTELVTFTTSETQPKAKVASSLKSSQNLNFKAAKQDSKPYLNPVLLTTTVSQNSDPNTNETLAAVTEESSTSTWVIEIIVSTLSAFVLGIIASVVICVLLRRFRFKYSRMSSDDERPLPLTSSVENQTIK